MPDQRLTYLFERYLNDTCTPEEKRELAALALTNSHEESLNDLMEQYWEKVIANEDMTEKAAMAMLHNIIHPVGNEVSLPKQKSWVVPLRRIAVAASVLLFIGLGVYFLIFDSSNSTSPVGQITNPQTIPAPADNRAMIILADGKRLYLDQVGNGQVAKQGNVELIRLADGQILYQGNTTEVAYNTLSNPRGSKVITITLADGSKVWLNAESSVTYPVDFHGTSRKVTVTGEAYFEVFKNTSMPFIVSKGDMEVHVLGTHFNVNTYDNESAMKITLLEGAVKVSNGKASKTLKPGEQARIAASRFSIHPDVDMEEVMAWKNGLFNFDNATLQEVMSQLERWYDIEVEYDEGVPDIKFGGKITKDVSLDDLLVILQKSEVHFRLEGRKLIVLP